MMDRTWSSSLGFGCETGTSVLLISLPSCKRVFGAPAGGGRYHTYVWSSTFREPFRQPHEDERLDRPGKPMPLIAYVTLGSFRPRRPPALPSKHAVACAPSVDW